MQSVNTTDTAIQATITDMGEVVDIVIPVGELQATLFQGCSLGLEETGQESFTVSPNPTAGTVSITHPNGTGEVFVYDIFGKLVLSTQTATQTSIDLSGEAPGIYLIQIDGMEVKRVVRE